MNTYTAIVEEARTGRKREIKDIPARNYEEAGKLALIHGKQECGGTVIVVEVHLQKDE